MMKTRRRAYSFSHVLLWVGTGTLIGLLITSILPWIPDARQTLTAIGDFFLPPFGRLMLIVVLASLLGWPIFALRNRMWRSIKLGLLDLSTPVFVLLVTAYWVSVAMFGLYRPLIVYAAVAFVLWLALSQPAHPQLAPQPSQQGLLDPDTPIQEDGEDELGRNPVIEVLLKLLLYERPLVAAVTAPWGDGKTSFLNLTIGKLRKLESPDRPLIVRFSPWLAADSNALVLSLLNSIRVEIDKLYVIPGLKRDASEYGRALLSAIPKLEKLGSFFSESSQQEKIGGLAKRIAKMDRRIIVVLDDLDRMEASELETVFRLLCGSENFPKVTFLCSFDEAQLAGILNTKRPDLDAPKYIEKFFQLTIALPKIESSQLKPLFLNKVDRVLASFGKDQLRDDDVARIWDTAGHKYFVNLRRIKLFVNKIRYSVERIGNEVNFPDFIRLEMIQSISPSLYDDIYSNPYYFFDSDLAFETIFSSPLPRDKTRARTIRHEFYKDLFAKREVPAYVWDLLTATFPYIADYRQKSFSGLATLEQDRRACHPRFFQQYFTLKVPSELFSQSEFEKYVLAARSAPSERAFELFEEIFSKLRDADFRRWHFVHLVETAFDKFGLPAMKGTCLAFASNSDAWTSDAFELGSAIRCTRTAMVQIPLSNEREDLFLQIAEKSRSLLYPLVLLRAFESNFGELLPKDTDRIGRSLKDRLRKHYLRSDPPSVFQELNTDMGRIEPIQLLMYWRNLGSDADSDEREYLGHLFERDPASLDLFLKSMFRVDFLDDYTNLKPLISYRKLSQIMVQHKYQLDATKYKQFTDRYTDDIQRDARDID